MLTQLADANVYASHSLAIYSRTSNERPKLRRFVRRFFNEMSADIDGCITRAMLNNEKKWNYLEGFFIYSYALND